MSLTYEAVAQLPDIRFVSPMALLFAIRLLTHAWVLAGAHLVPSSTNWDPDARAYRKVRQCHMSTATWYQGHC